MNDRKLQLNTYSELLQQVVFKKPIDIDMAIESFFKNLYIHSTSFQYHKKKLFHDKDTEQFYFEYDYEFEGLMSLGCSHKIRDMFHGLNISEKKSFRYITRMMNRHHNISKVNRIYYFTNW